MRFLLTYKDVAQLREALLPLEGRADLLGVAVMLVAPGEDLVQRLGDGGTLIASGGSPTKPKRKKPATKKGKTRAVKPPATAEEVPAGDVDLLTVPAPEKKRYSAPGRPKLPLQLAEVRDKDGRSIGKGDTLQFWDAKRSVFRDGVVATILPVKTDYSRSAIRLDPGDGGKYLKRAIAAECKLVCKAIEPGVS